MTNQDIIKSRVSKSFTNKALKDSMYRYRRFSIGDDAAIGGQHQSAGFDSLLKLKKSNPAYPLFRLAHHEKGVYSLQLQWISVLIDSVALAKPTVYFPDLSSKASKVREAWVHDKLFQEADWSSHQTRFLYSFFVDGLSFWKVGYWDDKLQVRSVDTLNMFWDLNPDLPSESQWVAEQVCITTKAALKLMGKAAVQMLQQGKIDPTGEERLIVLEYWDKDTLAYLHPNGTKVLKTKQNPYGCVPYECMFGDMYPSLFAPIPHIARTIGITTAINELSRTIMERVRTGRPVVEIDPTAYTPESMEDYRAAGSDVEYMIRAQDENGQTMGEGMRYVLPPDIGPELLNLQRLQEERVISLFGVNPAAGGYNPQVDFAAQVAAIQANSNLLTTKVTEEYTQCLSRVFRKLVKIGSKFDDAKFETTQNGETFSYGPEWPPSQLLARDVPCEVSPGSIDNPSLRLLKLNRLWEILTPELKARLPKLEKEILVALLQDAGLNDTETMLEEATPPAPPLEMPLDQIQLGQ